MFREFAYHLRIIGSLSSRNNDKVIMRVIESEKYYGIEGSRPLCNTTLYLSSYIENNIMLQTSL